MNQRVVLIALIALFVSCFVGTGAIATLAVIDTVLGASPSSGPDEPTRAEPDEGEPDEGEPDEGAPEPEVDRGPVAGDDSEALDEDDEPVEYEPPAFASAQFAVFHLEKPKVDPLAALRKAAKGRVTVYLGEAPESASPPYLEVHQPSLTDFPVREDPNGRGLTPQVKKALAEPQGVTAVDVVMPLGQVSLLEVSKVLAAFARSTHGVLWDQESQEYLSQDAWKKRRIDSWEKGVPYTAMNFMVFVETVEKGVELSTAGLRHLGLPELELKNVSRSSRDSAVEFINAVAQTLAERKGPITPGPLEISLAALRHKQHRESLEEQTFKNARKVVEVMMAPGSSDDVATLAITFPGDGMPTERVEAGLAALFGSADKIDEVNHDEELDALSQEQMEIYRAQIKKRFRKGLKYGEVLLVKAPFETASGGNEWMWVEVTKLGAGGKIEGLLANDPDDVPALHSGSEVVVQERELFDWMMQEADGTSIGNETGKVMQSRRAK